MVVEQKGTVNLKGNRRFHQVFQGYVGLQVSDVVIVIIYGDFYLTQDFSD